MLRKSQDKNKKIGDCKNVFQREKLDGIKVMFIEDVTLGVRPLIMAGFGKDVLR